MRCPSTAVIFNYQTLAMSGHRLPTALDFNRVSLCLLMVKAITKALISMRGFGDISPLPIRGK